MRLEVTRIVICPQFNERTEIDDCKGCELFSEMDTSRDPSNPDVICLYGIQKGDEINVTYGGK